MKQRSKDIIEMCAAEILSHTKNEGHHMEDVDYNYIKHYVSQAVIQCLNEEGLYQ